MSDAAGLLVLAGRIGAKEKCWDYCEVEGEVDKKFRKIPCIKKVVLEYGGKRREKCVMYDAAKSGVMAFRSSNDNAERSGRDRRPYSWVGGSRPLELVSSSYPS